MDSVQLVLVIVLRHCIWNSYAIRNF